MHGFRCSASTLALLSEILVILLISLQWVELLDGKPRQGIPKCNKKVAFFFCFEGFDELQYIRPY